MQISPHIETFDFSRLARAELPQMQSFEMPDPGISTFAEMLAGQLRETKTESSTENISSAEAPEYGAANNRAEDDEEEPDSAGLLVAVNPFAKTTEAGEKPVIKPAKTETPDEPEALDFSDLDQNILLGPQQLLAQVEGHDSIPSDEEVSSMLALAKTDKLVKVETAKIEAAEKKTENIQAEFGDLDIEGLSADGIGKASGAGKAGEAEVSEEQDLKAAKGSPSEKGKLRNVQDDSAGKWAESVAFRQAAHAEESTARKNNDSREGRAGRLEEARGKDKRRQASLEVRDLRTGQTGGEEAVSMTQRLNGQRFDGQRPESGQREISLELRLDGKSQAVGSMGQTGSAGQTGAAGAAGSTGAESSMENLLARELHQNFNNDIVRHASMILRDEGQGTIRLALKPESLGNVKIRLEMAENKVIGHIVVESEEALRAFEKEIHSLEQAFKDSGFQGASFEMSLASDGRGAEQWQQGAEASAFLTAQAASRYDAQEWVELPLGFIDLYQQDTTINMFA